MRRLPVLLIAGSVAAIACGGGERPPTPDDPAFTPRPLAAELAGRTIGLRSPSSVRYDEALDVFYIASMDGGDDAKDGRASISIVPAETLAVIRVLVDGSAPEITLHAPRGLAITGDTLWAADLDAVRGFHRRTGAPVATIDLSAHGARSLHDVAVGPNGALYVTETGRGDDGAADAARGRIFRIANRVVAEVARGATFRSPNGITWQDTTGLWIIAPAAGREVLTWSEGDAAPRALVSGPGAFDGVEALRDGRLLVASAADSSIAIIERGTMTPLIRQVLSPGDFGYDLRRGVVAVPRVLDGVVEYYQLRARG